MRRPDNEIPAIAPVRGVLNRTPDFVLALTSTTVFSRAVEWTVEAYRRSTGGVPMSGWGFGKTETTGHSSPPMLFGIEWANGEFASNMPGRRMHGGLSNTGTSRGSPQHFQVTFRLDHLPPPGPFTVVTAWPFYDVKRR
ncbi:hypothetical protein QSJ19_02340 [Gordonia sp. ABSL11-1]|uniref:hypothetical protein n=1 Tax=Gordonia sp. ABSL11-1 TaxID=3053924 RepID=UPI00257449F6|nr:hypothetical protein [Gordonia sp. ABSL11-1]MDL9944442.1 hypothetical protein [Gordonia sp. ABSL11-1]